MLNNDGKIKHQVLDHQNIRRTISRMSHEIIEANPDNNPVVILGIMNGGINLARRFHATLHELLHDLPLELGYLDISPFRDDLRGDVSVPDRSIVPGSITGKKVILVDDVLATGRSVRCCLVSLVKYGSPQAIELAVFIDRGKRAFPIAPHYVGKNLPLANDEKVIIRINEEIHPDEKVYIRKNNDFTKE